MPIASGIAITLLAFAGWQILTIVDASETEVAKVAYSLVRGAGAMAALFFIAANGH